MIFAATQKGNEMTYKRLLTILQSYVENDYQASCSPDCVREALSEVATKEEIFELGFGWLYPDE